MLGYPDMTAVDWSQLRFHDTVLLREKLIKQYTPATVNKYLWILRSVLKYAYSLGQMSAEDYRGAIQVQDLDLRAPMSTGRELTQEEIAVLMAACDTGTPIEMRDAAVI